MMKVLSPGTDVTIEQANIPGKITTVNIHADHVRYEVTYYVDYTQRTATLAERDLLVNAKNKKITVGFK
jgi:hypothetical protein